MAATEMFITEGETYVPMEGKQAILLSISSAQMILCKT